MSTDQKTEKLTPEAVLMNVLADCGRIERLLIIADCNDNTFEFWSNNLDLVERAGMLRIANIRLKKKIQSMEDID